MKGDQHYRRVDLVEAKNLITKKLGGQKAERYFNLLNRFLTKKLNKSDFDKLCVVAVGRENINLHNWFIRSIVKNACLSTSPPAKPGKLECSVNGKAVNGYQISCIQSIYKELIPKSPRKGRTPTFRDRRYKDQPSPLGPHGKPQTVACQQPAPKVLEQQNAVELHSVGSRPAEVIDVQDEEEVDQTAEGPVDIYSWKNLAAPIGVQTRAKVAHASSVPMGICYGKEGELPDTYSLKKRLEQKLEAEGLKVSLDCANLLNKSLDVYLKKLIEPGLGLIRSRTQNKEMRVQSVPRMNGMQLQHMRYAQSQRPTNYTRSSLVDVNTAMELDPTLQQNWQVGNFSGRFN